MKTEEFVREIINVSKVRYSTCRDPGRTVVYDEISGERVLTVSEILRFSVEFHQGFYSQQTESKEALYSLATEYAATPIEERREPKKYIYEFPYFTRGMHPDNGQETQKIAKLNDGSLELDPSSMKHAKQSGTFHFTDKDVEQYTGKDRLLFDICEKIEVT